MAQETSSCLLGFFFSLSLLIVFSWLWLLLLLLLWLLSSIYGCSELLGARGLLTFPGKA
jgi:hypothetical protein